MTIKNTRGQEIRLTDKAIDTLHMLTNNELEMIRDFETGCMHAYMMLGQTRVGDVPSEEDLEAAMYNLQYLTQWLTNMKKDFADINPRNPAT